MMWLSIVGTMSNFTTIPTRFEVNLLSINYVVNWVGWGLGGKDGRLPQTHKAPQSDLAAKAEGQEQGNYDGKCPMQIFLSMNTFTSSFISY